MMWKMSFVGILLKWLYDSEVEPPSKFIKTDPSLWSEHERQRQEEKLLNVLEAALGAYSMVTSLPASHYITEHA